MGKFEEFIKQRLIEELKDVDDTLTEIEDFEETPEEIEHIIESLSCWIQNFECLG